MMSRTFKSIVVVFILLGFCFLPLIASAHEQVTAGSYQLEIGWVKEPVIVGELNGLDLFITQATATSEHDHAEDTAQATATSEHDHAEDTTQTSQEAGVSGAEATLKFAVEYGGASQSYDLRPVADQPGHYTADLIPTREGQYTFHLTGAINNEAVEIKIEPEEVVSAGKLAFPEPMASAADTAAQLAAAQSQARTTQMIAIGGVVLGLLGTGLGVYGLIKKK
jgi:hypothetical protein